MIVEFFKECLNYFFKKIKTDTSYIDSIKYFIHVNSANEDNPFLYYVIGNEILEYNNSLDSYDNSLDSLAYEYFETALGIDALNPLFWNAIGQIYYNKNEFKNAINIYTYSRDLDTCYADTYFLLGLSYFKYFNEISDYDAYYIAIYYFKKFIEQNPFNPISYYNIGYIYFLLKDYKRAEE